MGNTPLGLGWKQLSAVHPVRRLSLAGWVRLFATGHKQQCNVSLNDMLAH